MGKVVAWCHLRPPTLHEHLLRDSSYSQNSGQAWWRLVGVMPQEGRPGVCCLLTGVFYLPLYFYHHLPSPLLLLLPTPATRPLLACVLPLPATAFSLSPI